ncbi:MULTISPECIES: Crp/Fnr family transcriptional regulator [Reichenbachiella]|uniref:Crp/Fnr family transcriptional regulator n=1 Tax=Reichenbachiella TaxID=156993 RepID=UPI000E6CC27A|nr:MULTISPECIES: Crp/Fnr family transcriptional regulator [Reichenbachiella]MBU2912946.1 Crp/Fnr family transcriptional regulator [Reichenbachiella agariperforans]RJE72814.1 Crp/Fnr family transcriptional regulator [Reichenbachiella sp. MSK19-1]
MNRLYRKFDFMSNFLLQELSEPDKRKVMSCFEPMTFKRGDRLFYEDGIPTGTFYITKGTVKKYKKVVGDQEQIFYIYKEGDLLGYHALLSDERYQDSCEALESITTEFISKDNFMELMETIPSLKAAVIKNMAHEFGVLANTIAVLAQKAQTPRLALFLLILNNRYDSMGIKLSRQDLSNLIGATRESVGRTLKEFKDDGLIEIRDKKIFLVDMDKIISKVEMPLSVNRRLIDS